MLLTATTWNAGQLDFAKEPPTNKDNCGLRAERHMLRPSGGAGVTCEFAQSCDVGKISASRWWWCPSSPCYPEGILRCDVHDW